MKRKARNISETALRMLLIASACMPQFSCTHAKQTAAMPVGTNIVETNFGKVEGMVYEGYSRYLGIPYAEAPLGELRFMPPQKPKPWEGVLKACTWPKDPVQQPYDVKKHSEDCLKLNIWVPAGIKTDAPVMVWIYGGSYATGGTVNGSEDPEQGLYNGANLCMGTGAVVVTLNYRLNVTGFLDLRRLDRRFTCNNGLRDVVAALSWVHDNIAAFGGNPNNVTVAGESAGGAITLSLLTIPEAGQYYQKIICESSGADGYASQRQSEELTEKWLELMGNPTADELVNMPADSLIARQEQLDKFVTAQRLDCTFCPVIDGQFLVCSPADSLLHTSKQLLIGWNHDEANLFINFLPKEIVDSPEHIATALPFQTDEERRHITAATKGFPSKEAYEQIATERMYSIAITKVADRLSHTSSVFVYRYDYATPGAKLLGLGSCHASELPIVFGNIPKGYDSFCEKDVAMLTKKFHDYWHGFLHNGKPSADWPVYSIAKGRSVRIINSEEDHNEQNPLGERLRLYGIE